MSDEILVIKKLAKAGHLIVGTKTILKNLHQGKIEAIWTSRTVGKSTTESLKKYASFTNVPITLLEISGDDLGILCKKQFSVSAIAKVKSN